MFRKRGIAFKTFVFTSLLIGLVLTLSLGLLFTVMPDYYLYTKTTALEKGADQLAQELASLDSKEKLAQSISAFSLVNNADVISLNNRDELLADLSTPFVSMTNASFGIQNFTIVIKNNDAVTYGEMEAGLALSGISAASEDSGFKISDDAKLKVIPDDMTSETNQIYGPVTITTTTADRVSFVELSRLIDNPFLQQIQITSTLQPIDEAMGVIWSLAPYLLAADLLIALLAAYLYASRLTKPIIRLSQTASKMQTMEPGIASGLHTGDELEELSYNLDSLYQSLCTNIGYLKEEMEKVTVLEKSKTDFMRAASHELKTPIAALNGIVEGMLDNVGKYRNRDAYLIESKKLIQRLAVLVSEILNASRLEQPESLLAEENCSPAEIIEGILARQEIFIEQKQIQITFDRQPVIVCTDPNILENTLSNILSNAVRYTAPGGSVLIGWEQSRQRPGIALWVENECKPLPQEELKKLFEPFYTVSYSRNRDESGTGLGLYIVRKNLEALKLPYTLESTALGLRFTIYFEYGNQL